MLKSREIMREKNRGRVFSLVAREQRSVAVGNKVMDTRLPQPAGCGDKYDVSGLGLKRLFSAFYTFFKYPSPEAYASPSPSRGEGSGLYRPWCHKILGTGPSMTGGRGANFFGRSMIEILGVLAIIAVLSVGGIAGYSKAMEKYKLNKVLNQYSHLLQGLIEYGGKMRNSGNYDVQLGDAVNAIGLIPSTWHYLNSSGLQNFQDDIGNSVHIVSREGDLVFNLSLRANDAQFSSKTCVNFFQYIFQPLHSTFKRIVMFDMNSVNPNQWYFGDSLCSNYNCLNNMTLSAMHNACGYCAEREGSGCFMVIQF